MELWVGQSFCSLRMAPFCEGFVRFFSLFRIFNNLTKTSNGMCRRVNSECHSRGQNVECLQEWKQSHSIRTNETNPFELCILLHSKKNTTALSTDSLSLSCRFRKWQSHEKMFCIRRPTDWLSSLGIILSYTHTRWLFHEVHSFEVQQPTDAWWMESDPLRNHCSLLLAVILISMQMLKRVDTCDKKKYKYHSTGSIDVNCSAFGVHLMCVLSMWTGIQPYLQNCKVSNYGIFIKRKSCIIYRWELLLKCTLKLDL